MKLDANGKIPSDFWSYEIQINEEKDWIKPVETNVNLLQQAPIDFEDDPKKISDLITVLKNNGFDPGDNEGQGTAEECVSQFNVKEIKTSGLYTWCVCGKYFLINPNKPSQVIFLEELIGCDRAWDISVQKLGKNIFRVFLQKTASDNGCGGSLKVLSIYDCDFINNSFKTYKYPEGSYAQDFTNNECKTSEFPRNSFPKEIDGKDDYSLIIYPDIGEGVHWPWVFSWDGEKWINSNLKYWKYFKNGTIEPVGICEGRGRIDLLNAFKQAIRDDEPLKYWKYNR